MPVFRIIGAVVLGLAGLMIVPLAFDIAAGEGRSSAFTYAIAINVFVGATLIIVTSGRETTELTRRQAFLTTGLAWLVAPARRNSVC